MMPCVAYRHSHSYGIALAFNFSLIPNLGCLPHHINYRSISDGDRGGVSSDRICHTTTGTTRTSMLPCPPERFSNSASESSPRRRFALVMPSSITACISCAVCGKPRAAAIFRDSSFPTIWHLSTRSLLSISLLRKAFAFACDIFHFFHLRAKGEEFIAILNPSSAAEILDTDYGCLLVVY